MNTHNNDNAGRAARDQQLFEDIADSYSKKDLAASSRLARKMRLVQTIKACPFQWADKPSILEVGCGAGHSADYLSEQFSHYTGLDYSTQLVAHAESIQSSQNTTFIAEDLYQFESSSSFDIVVMIGVLHHMTDIDKAISTCLALLKPGGFFVVNEPQPNNPIIGMMRKVRAKIDSTYSEEQEELSTVFLENSFSNAGLINVGSKPQGVLSTPFAEVVMKPQFIFHSISKGVCAIDRRLEKKHPQLIKNIAWNTIVYGEKA